MATTGIPVTKDATNVVASLTLAAGNYKIQNVGQSQIRYAESVAEPIATAYWHILDPIDSDFIEVAAEGWWFKTFYKTSELAVTPAS